MLEGDFVSCGSHYDTDEDALLLYLNPKGELQEKHKWEDGGERHFIPHECGSYLQKKHINAFSGDRDPIHSVEQLSLIHI